MLFTDSIDDCTALGFSIGPILIAKEQKRSSAGWTSFVLSRVLVSSSGGLVFQVCGHPLFEFFIHLFELIAVD